MNSPDSIHEAGYYSFLSNKSKAIETRGLPPPEVFPTLSPSPQDNKLGVVEFIDTQSWLSSSWGSFTMAPVCVQIWVRQSNLVGLTYVTPFLR